MDFNFRTIVFACHCGLKAPVIYTLGGTDDGCLIAFWFCPRCRKRVGAKIKIEDVIAGLPTKDTPPTADVEFDSRFLHSAGIKETDDDIL